MISAKQIRIAFWVDSLVSTISTGAKTFQVGLLSSLIERYSHLFTFTLWSTRSLDPTQLFNLLPKGSWRHVTVPLKYDRPCFKITWLLGFPNVCKWLGPHDLFLSGYHWPLGRKDVPFVGIVHDLIPLEFREEHANLLKSHMSAMIYDWSIQIACKKASRIICISDFTHECLCSHLPQYSYKYSVIPHGMRIGGWRSPVPEHFLEDFWRRTGISANAPFILSIGQHIHRKNFARLIDAFASVAIQCPADLRLILIGGENTETLKLETRTKSLAMEDRIHMVGHVPPEVVYGLMQKASIFAFPSLYEGFGFPVLEAFAAGTPVVCSSTTSLKGVAGDAALTVDPEDTTALAGGILRLLSDQCLRGELISRGKERVSLFTWDSCADAYARIFLDLMNSVSVQGTPSCK